MIERETLLGRYWCFYHEGKAPVAEFFRFNSDGTVGGYDHENERRWDIIDGSLYIFNWRGEPTTIFRDCQVVNGLTELRGPHIADPKIILCFREQDGGRLRHSLTKNGLLRESKDFGWDIGEHTYGIPAFDEHGLAKFSIGKYCSIAAGVRVALGNHKTDFATTYPFATLRRYWQCVPRNVSDHTTKGDVKIGNDVWIASNVFIGSGVTIGDGAVIGAGTVVVKDVPAYSIYVGSPGRVIKYRFDEDVISDLLSLQWWNLDDEIVDRLIPQLLSTDVAALISNLRDIRTRSGSSVE